MTGPTQPPTNGGVRIDLHVHTGRYSQCAECLDPYGIGASARHAGLAGVVITEHDMFWQDEEIEILRNATPGLSMYRGIEVSALGCHLVVIGVDEPGPLFRGIPAAEVISFAAAHGGVTILAHPFRDGDLSVVPVERVDAVEVASTSFSESEARQAVELCAAYGKPAVAASDAHALALIGWAWTEFPYLPGNESELANAIRSGLGRPVAPRPCPG